MGGTGGLNLWGPDEDELRKPSHCVFNIPRTLLKCLLISTS